MIASSFRNIEESFIPVLFGYVCKSCFRTLWNPFGVEVKLTALDDCNLDDSGLKFKLVFSCCGRFEALVGTGLAGFSDSSQPDAWKRFLGIWRPELDGVFPRGWLLPLSSTYIAAFRKASYRAQLAAGLKWATSENVNFWQLWSRRRSLVAN